MRKFFLILFAFFCLFVTDASAQTQFTTSYKVTYDIQENGGASVTKNISIKNNTSEYYASDFTLRIPDSGLTNVKATRNKRDLTVKTEKKEDIIEMYVQFRDQVVGMNKALTFDVTYNSKDVAQLKGDNLEVSIPGIDKDYTGAYEVVVNIPKSRYTSSARVLPQPSKTEDKGEVITYTFAKDQLTDNSVLMNFGDNQTYDMSLLYYLKNPTDNRVRVEVALPPSTEYQTVMYEELSIKPYKLRLDDDGNYIAEYTLQPNEEKEITARTKVIVSSQQRHTFAPLTENQKTEYLKQQEYWDVGDEQIQQLARELQTPEAIYDYVVKTLSYDTEKRDVATIRRQGSIETLKNPTKAVCMEFTDLFIAIARAAGIPAREITGYGFTNEMDKNTQTLFADNFHAWPEYYDDKLGRWIQVDPTWEKTTGGLDYFSQFDTNHIAFAKRGISSTFPVGAGSYRRSENDRTVFVSYSNEQVEVKESVELSVDTQARLAGFADNLIISAKNTGNTGYIGMIQTKVSPENIISAQNKVVHIPPFSEISLENKFQTAWHTSTNLNISASDANDQLLLQKNVAIKPLYMHPYTQLAGGYIFIIGILLVVFQRFIRHH